uniref:Putative metalloprotease n=1 Tax=Ixodes ricinus TaxID=34613 RepID=A0A0K8R3X8_IXORI
MAPVSKHQLSVCTKEALRQIYNNNTKDACWNKTPQPDESSNRSLPATYFQKENYCFTQRQERPFECPVGNKYYIGNATRCRVGCCINNTSDAGGFIYPVPDGTPPSRRGRKTEKFSFDLVRRRVRFVVLT